MSEILLNIYAQAGIGDPNHFNNFLILGYFVMWLIAMVYVVSLAVRQRNAQEEIKLMQQLLEEDEQGEN